MLINNDGYVVTGENMMMGPKYLIFKKKFTKSFS
jgi:hypothetical protein